MGRTPSRVLGGAALGNSGGAAAPAQVQPWQAAAQPGKRGPWFPPQEGGCARCKAVPCREVVLQVEGLGGSHTCPPHRPPWGFEMLWPPGRRSTQGKAGKMVPMMRANGKWVTI